VLEAGLFQICTELGLLLEPGAIKGETYQVTNAAGSI
jgi:hypothetical protein